MIMATKKSFGSRSSGGAAPKQKSVKISHVGDNDARELFLPCQKLSESRMVELANPENGISQKTEKDAEKTELSEEEITRLQKTIKIENLRHPGGWIHNPQIQRMLNRSQNFFTKFSRPSESSEKLIKSGYIEIEFSTVDVARDSYVTLQKIMIDGAKLLISVDSVFFEAASSVPTSSYFSPPDEQVCRNCTIYALYLPRSTDKTLLESIIGPGVINDFRMLPMPHNDGLIQAQIIVVDEETASTITAEPEDFPIDDGEQQTTAKLMNADEYLVFLKAETAAKPFVVSNGNHAKNGDEKEDREDKLAEVDPEEVLAPEIEENEVLQKLEQYIEDERVNFAEINEKHELYALCDSVSAGYGGLPDSMLKPILLTALQRYLNRTEMHWMREHVEMLIKIWKAEVLSEVFFERPTVVRMEPVAYKPPVVEERKKGNQKKAKAARALMGVGAFLSQNRDRLLLDSGEVDLEEDDEGNVLLGGEKLSFESWAKKTKTKGSGVVRAMDDGTKKIGTGGLSKKQLRMARTVEGMAQEEYKKWRKEKTENRRAEIKERIMKRGLVNEEEGEEEVAGEEEKKKENGVEEKKPAKVLDEGEIDSEEERKEDLKKVKKRKRDSSDSDSSSSSSSSSSSEEDSDGEPSGSRQRRTKRRIKDRKRGRSAPMQPKISPVFKAMYDNRKAIIANMLPAHKLAFANVLNQIRQSNAPVNQTQATQMMNAMFNNGGGFK